MTFDEFNELIKPEIQEIITNNISESPDLFVLKNASKTQIPIKAIAEQIDCYQRAQKKIPDLLKNNLILKKKSVEQASTKWTANYKNEIITGKTLIDMTGGLGIDSIYFSQKFDQVIYCELDSLLSKITEYNLKQLQINNIEIKNCDSVEFIKNLDFKVDVIFIDPARRDNDKRSVDLKFCQPDISELEDLLTERSETVLIKLSPAFDYAEAKKVFKKLKEYIVISVDRECKEVLLKLSNTVYDEIIKKAVLISSSTNRKIEISQKENELINIREYQIPEYFLYEPDPAIIKSGLTKKIAQDYNLSQIDYNSVLLTSDQLKNDFPGRKFKIVKLIEYNEKNIKKHLKKEKIIKANISKRNFTQSVESLKKVYNIKDGGSDYLFFASSKILNKKIFLHCQKV